MSIKSEMKRIFDGLDRRHFFDFVPDKIYLKLRFYVIMGKRLNLKNPKTYSEKLQWLKLYDRKPEYTKMVDKYEAKKFVADIIGEECTVPTYGVWDKFEDINFDDLPDKFVLKCTHDSGGLVICRDKSKLDIAKAKQKIERSLKKDYFITRREWPYKNVKPRIIAEKYLEDEYSKELSDYKFYCFNGEPKMLYVSRGLENHETARISFVTMDWKQAPLKRNDYESFEELPPKPQSFDLMVEYSRRLSKDIPFLRVDFYDVNGKLYFGELTFFPGAGFTALDPEEWDYTFGSWITLPDKE